MSPPNGNGSRVTFGWVAGVLLTVLLLLGGALFGDMRSDLNKVQDSQATRNETQAAMRSEMNAVNARLDRIEAKLDDALKWGRR